MKKLPSFQLLFWNVHGLANKYDTDFWMHINELKPDFLCFCETWYNQEFDITRYLENYCSISIPSEKTQSGGRSRGGILIGYKKNLILKTLHQDSNAITCKITNAEAKHEMIVNCIYVPPGKPNDYMIEELFNRNNQYILQGKTVIILGDLNARTAKLNTKIFKTDNWEIFPRPGLRESLDEKADERGRVLIDKLLSEDYMILNGVINASNTKGMTFYNANGNSVIDYALVNIDAVENVTNLEIKDWDNSDHFPLLLTMYGHEIETYLKTEDQPRTKDILNYKWDDEKNLHYKDEISIICQEIIDKFETLKDINNEIDHEFDPDMWYLIFKQMIEEGCKKINLKPYGNTKRNKNKQYYNPLWFDDAARGKYLDKRAAARKYAQTRNETDLQNLIKLKKEYTIISGSAIKRCQEQIIKKITNVKNGKEFWETINTFKKKKKSFKMEIDIQSLKKFYQLLFERKRPTRIEILPLTINDEIDRDIEWKELVQVVKKIKRGKAKGFDGIRNEFVKNLDTGALCILWRFLSCVWRTTKIPSDWGCIQIVPIYKKDDKTRPENYRPISLTSCCLRILTTILLARIKKWLEERNLIPQEQAAFRAGRSCTDQLFILSNAIKTYQRGQKKKCKKVYVCFIDLAKAFDSVPHDLLWHKLVEIGMSTKMIMFLQTLYRSLKAQILTNDDISDWFPLQIGVLQGESLSPDLFSIYIADMQKGVAELGGGVPINQSETLTMLYFADDMACMAVSEIDLQMKINWIEKYMKENELKVNIEKTKIMIFEKPKTKPKFKWKWGNSQLEIVDTYNYLGLTLDKKMNFGSCLNMQKNKAKKAIKEIQKISYQAKITQHKPRLLMFDALAKSILMYASQIWSYRYREEIDSIQATFLRYLLEIDRKTPSYILHLEMGRQSLEYNINVTYIKYWIKIMKLGNERIERKVYDAMVNLYPDIDNQSSESWTTVIKQILIETGFTGLWINQNPDLVLRSMPQIKIRITEVLINKALTKKKNAKIHPWYKDMNIPISGEPYLLEKRHVHLRILKSQLRLNLNKILIRGKTIVFDEKFCDICNESLPFTMFHLVKACQIFECYRDDIRYILTELTEQNCRTILATLDYNAMEYLYRYFITFINYCELLIID